MDSRQSRGDGPRRRRAFIASEKLAHLSAYEQACEHGDGGGYLRRFGGITTAPKILDLSDTVWINQPADDTDQKIDTEAA